jgi:antitoxin (DNA-binding transcriptional repressor) of toxin-antitoxin stability system
MKFIGHISLAEHITDPGGGVLHEVKNGDRVTVLHGSTPVAVLVPVAELAELDQARKRLIVVASSDAVPAGSFPDARVLLERCVKGIGRLLSRRHSGPRREVVHRLTGLGSTYSALLCGTLDLDPDQEIGLTEWLALEELLGDDFDEERWLEIFGDPPPPGDERGRLDEVAS